MLDIDNNAMMMDKNSKYSRIPNLTVIFLSLFIIKKLNMELKCFIKNVISDITNAVKESQEELNNGAIVSPANIGGDKDYAKNKQGDKYHVSVIDFEVAVSVSSESEMKAGIKGGIKVLSASISGNSTSGKEDTSKVSFRIPVIYPSVPMSQLKANHEKV